MNRPEQARKLYESGKSQTEVAKILGCHTTTVGNLVIKAGGVLRTRAQVAKARSR